MPDCLKDGLFQRSYFGGVAVPELNLFAIGMNGQFFAEFEDQVRIFYQYKN